MDRRRIGILVLAAILAALFLQACRTVVPTATPLRPTSTPTDVLFLDEVPTSTATGLLDEFLVERTPEPTATPGSLARVVERVSREIGLTRTYVLGLSAPDWINLGISLLMVLASYLVGTLLIHRILPYIIRRTALDLADRFVTAVGPDLRWLVVVFALQFATRRLTFVDAGLKDLLADLYFVAGLTIGVHGVWRLIDLLGEWYGQRAMHAGHEEQIAVFITLLERVARVVLLVIGFSILLSHFGLNVTAFAAVLGLGGLAVSLGARDTIADAIAGFIILFDRPFRIGDRIEIQGASTWGDVVDIGLRTTRIRTRDNRMVIVPNSLIGQNQVINYTYPDPHYRIETRLGIAYGTDVEFVEGIIVDTVQQLPGVLREMPVEVLYDEMGDWAMMICVRWWIESYVDTRQMFDRVHRALQKALDGAGVEMPYPTQTLQVHREQE